MSLARNFCIAALALALAGCAGGGDSSWTAADENTVDSLPPQMCMPGKPDPRACDPADTKKTTVCHIPPGNPANEHTICVGNPAVPAHLAHGDHLGSCCGAATDGGVTTPPPPHDFAGVPPGSDLANPIS
jgi:hypothetical protein